MKKKLLSTVIILLTASQISCNSNGLNSVNLNEKFANEAALSGTSNSNNLVKPRYSKVKLVVNTSDNQLTGNLTDVKEFQVNQFGTGNGHSTPVVAMNNNSRFVVTWKQQSDIFAQIYDNKGLPQGEEFLVNKPEHIIYNEKKLPEYINTMDSPKVAIDNKGNFVVVWERLQRALNSATAPVKSDIFARSFDSNGYPLNGEFKVNSAGNDIHKYPAIARNSNGDFIISWTNLNQDGSSNGIYARKYNALTIAGSQFLVTGNIREKGEPSVAINNEGKFVISWQNISDNNIYAKLFESNEQPAGNEFRVNNSSDGEHGLPGAGMDKAGNFVITWQKTSGDGSVFGIFARRYGSTGSPTGSEFRVNSNTNNPYEQYEPAIAMNSNGNFVITWQNLNTNFKGEAGIFAQKFSNAGVKLGSEFLVKTYSGVEGTDPSAAIDINNNFIITWADSGIHAKMFDSNNFNR